MDTWNRRCPTFKYREVLPLIPSSNISKADYFHQAETNIFTILQEKATIIPSLVYGNITYNAYVDIAKILQCTPAPLYAQPC